MTSQTVPLEQLEMLISMVGESGRRQTVQLPGEFARVAGGATPLRQLLRMSEAALKVYLTLVMATRKPPHELFTSTSASRFARMLGFDDSLQDDPQSNGTRKVQRAIATLHKTGFIERTPRSGQTDLIKVKHFGPEMPVPWITLPLEMWRNGWINLMTPPSLVVYLALRRECAGKETTPIHVSPFMRKAYGFSDETWQRGAQHLSDLGFVSVSQGLAKDRDALRRPRTLYDLHSFPTMYGSAELQT